MQRPKYRLAGTFFLLFLALAAATVWLSHQPAQESYQFTSSMMDSFEGTGLSALTPDMELFRYDAYRSFRKWGHIYLFALLGASAAAVGHSLRGHRPEHRLSRPLWREWLLPLGVCALHAALDELHQGFVPGREAHIRDFGFDLFGSLLGVLAAGLLAAALRGIARRRAGQGKEK